MSATYSMEPTTSGKVVLETTKVTIEIELWAKEMPLASRNFVQLCMENYFDNTQFHRIIPGFMVQGGDPTNTGAGGESVYTDGMEGKYTSRTSSTLEYLLTGVAWSLAQTNQNQIQTGANFSSHLRPADIWMVNTLYLVKLLALPCSTSYKWKT